MYIEFQMHALVWKIDKIQKLIKCFLKMSGLNSVQHLSSTPKSKIYNFRQNGLMEILKEFYRVMCFLKLHYSAHLGLLSWFIIAFYTRKFCVDFLETVLEGNHRESASYGLLKLQFS